MLKLYGSGGSRWMKPYWLLREMKVPFETAIVRLSKGENLTPDFLAISPYAKIPVLKDGDQILTESTAICNYLADKHPEHGLIPKAGTFDRALHDQWMSFIISELEQPLWRIVRHRFLYPESRRSAAEIELATDDFLRIAAVLETQMTAPFLLGGRFSVADIAMTYTLDWARRGIMPPGLLAKTPKLEAYLDRHSARESFPRELYQK